MRSRSGQGQTFTNEARRAQIVACAIEVIAEEGYARTSIRKVAQRVGVAMSVVLYHFADKDDLVAAIVTVLYRSAIAMMVPALQAEDSARAKLAAYIRANAAFVQEHRPQHLALIDIGANYRSATGRRLWELDVDPELLADLAQIDLQTILTDGQRGGEFRRFDAAAMALAIRGALNSVVLEVAQNADFDVLGCAEELVTTFDLATRAAASISRPDQAGRGGRDRTGQATKAATS